jgi:hypothetical protein
VVRPRSYCPECEKPIAWFDNIPLLSFLLLKGRCRHCGKPIPARYPIVEAFDRDPVLRIRGQAGPFAGCIQVLPVLGSYWSEWFSLISKNASFPTSSPWAAW